MFFKIILLLSYTINAFPYAEGYFKDVKVELLNGIIQGFENRDYYGFQGIPYAEPPIKENRFLSPKPYTKKWNGIYNATRNDIICAQLNPGEYFDNFTIIGSEDCLYLNVYVPKIEDANELLPVMVYLHSGAFTYGSSNYLKERTLMRSKSFILVTLNYRLGPFGFLSTADDIISGNMGLKDQRLALQWTKDNIEYFHGNPNKILLTGFSAGAVSVDLQTISPGIENLVTAAVSFSGTSLSPWGVKIESLKVAQNLGRALKCRQYRNGKEILSCLNTNTLHGILKAFETLINQRRNGIQSFGPVVESKAVKDALITEHPRNILQKKISNIPYLSSFTAQDGAIVSLDLFRYRSNGQIALNQFKNTPLRYLHWLLFNDGFQPTPLSRKHTRDTLVKYSLTIPIKESHFNNLNKLFTDVLFKNGIKESLLLRQINSNISVYSYIYDNPPMLNVANLISKRMDLNFGTIHGDDVFLFLNSPVRNLIAFREDELDISKKFINMLKEFIETGKPKFGEIDFPESNVDVIRALRIKANKVEIEEI